MKKIDRCHLEYLQNFISEMAGDPIVAGTYTQYISVNKFIERIGNHSSNIAAMVVYMFEGRGVRYL